MDRRDFIKTVAVTGTLLATPQIAHAGIHQKEIKDSWMGCLVDLTLCNGCRKCEWACAKANERNFNPLETYEDKTVFKEFRRLTNHEYAVINKFKNAGGPGTDIFAKSQCLHCNDPACVSACIVGAFSKRITAQFCMIHGSAWDDATVWWRVHSRFQHTNISMP